MAQLEERYIVVKIKTLDDGQLAGLRSYLEAFDVPTLDCIVVEPDWPQYEPVKESVLVDRISQPLSQVIFDYREGETSEEMKMRLAAALEIEYARHMLQTLTLRSQLEEAMVEKTLADCPHPIQREYVVGGKGDHPTWLRQCIVCGDIFGK